MCDSNSLNMVRKTGSSLIFDKAKDVCLTVDYLADSQLFKLKDVKNSTEMSKKTCSNILIYPRNGPNKGLGINVQHKVSYQRNIGVAALLLTFETRKPSYLAAGVVGVLGQLGIESLEENLIRDLAHIHTGFIQHREDTFVLLLHQVDNDLIIEVINLTTKDREVNPHHTLHFKWNDSLKSLGH